MDNEDTIRSMIDDILMDRGNDALEKVNAMMGSKVTDALDQQRLDIASTLGQDHAELQDTQTDA